MSTSDPGLMDCPFCASQISEAANVCPHCTRDIYPFRPLIARIAALEARLEELAAGTPGRLCSGIDAPLTEESSRPAGAPDQGTWLRNLLPALLLLLLAHLLITQLWDASEWVLYATSIAIPIIPGFLLARRHHCPLPLAAVAGFLLAALAVLGMSGITVLLDGGDWLPQTAREWREFANFWMSIGFAYLAGALLGQVLHQRADDRLALLRQLANPALAARIDTESIRNSMERLDAIAKAALALSASAASIYSGLGRFLGT